MSNNKNNESRDPLARNLMLLTLIPRWPRSISTTALREALFAQGFDVALRSLQRDLSEKLSTPFKLMCSSDSPDPEVSQRRPYHWSFGETAKFGLPAVTPASALAMNLAEGHLSHLLPPSAMDLLAPNFEESRQLLQGMDHNHLSRWAKRVRSVPHGKALLPASVQAEVWHTVASALMGQQQLEVAYLSRAKNDVKPFTLHPKGLVSRGPATYLIASVGDYTDLRHFALHRIRSATVLDLPAAVDGFDIDVYLQTAAFTPRKGTGTMQLVADVHPQLAWTLRETALSDDQTLDPLPETDWLRLRACVPDDQETLWWVFGLGENILVQAPAELKQSIVEKTKRVLSMNE